MPTPGAMVGSRKSTSRLTCSSPSAAAHPVDDPPDRQREAVLVEPAHVDDVDAAGLEQPPLVGVDRADAEEMHVRGIDRGPRLAFEQGLEARLAAQHRDRHAVHVAGGRGGRGVVVRMGVEPEDEQFSPRLGGVARDAADRPHRQRVVAAEHQRQPPLAQDRVGLARQVARPGGDLGEMARPAFGRARHGRAEARGRGRRGRPRRARVRCSVRTIPAVRSIAGPIAQPGTPAPASIGAPITVIACRRGCRRPPPRRRRRRSVRLMLVPLSASRPRAS